MAGRHFDERTDPHAIGHKTLAVSLSDMAAMGAKPASVLLSLTLPEMNTDWLDGFLAGFSALATQFDVNLVGGDTTQGPLSISTVVFGHLPTSIAPLWRHGANCGDLIVVSGRLGGAARALHDHTANQTPLHYPQPRVKLGIALREIATSCIDISDGLIQDFSHVLSASNKGAIIQVDDIPIVGNRDNALTGGDDYELCFTLPAKQAQTLTTLSQQMDLTLTVIGEVTKEPELKLQDATGQTVQIQQSGFEHFA